MQVLNVCSLKPPHIGFHSKRREQLTGRCREHAGRDSLPTLCKHMLHEDLPLLGVMQLVSCKQKIKSPSEA